MLAAVEMGPLAAPMPFSVAASMTGAGEPGAGKPSKGEVEAHGSEAYFGCGTMRR